MKANCYGVSNNNKIYGQRKKSELILKKISFERANKSSTQIFPIIAWTLQIKMIYFYETIRGYV